MNYKIGGKGMSIEIKPTIENIHSNLYSLVSMEFTTESSESPTEVIGVIVDVTGKSVIVESLSEFGAPDIFDVPISDIVKLECISRPVKVDDSSILLN